MDRVERDAKLEELAFAEEGVREGAEALKQQLRILQELKRDNRDTKMAEELLATLQETQRLHEEHVQILKRELGEKWPAPGSEDTELGVFMGPEVRHGEAEVHARVQA